MSRFKNRSERNQGVRTLAQEIFSGKQIITKRIEGMSTEEYRLLRKQQDFILRMIFRKAPNRKLQNIMGQPNTGIIQRGFRPKVRQRRAS
jgi:hypothetical protein